MSKGKKGASLQIEVKTDKDWDDLLKLDGLILVDVYSEWSGPCIAMLSALKNIKLEVGGDLLKLARAENDGITMLARFRDRCEPVWMFIEGGKVVNIFFGANCPELKRLLRKEIARVMEKRSPKYRLEVEQRTPDEEARFRQEESKQRLSELRRMSREEEELREKNEKFLKRMMIELSEETALVIFPWVFYDDHGNQIDREQSAPYVDLVFKVLSDKLDVVEQVQIQLNEEIIEKLFLESDIIVTDDLIQALIDGKCLALRLKGRLPPADWPVSYPYTCSVETAPEDCPTRAINDIENYLMHVLNERPKTTDVKIKSKNFLERHRHVVSTGEETEDAEEVIEYPSVWFPSNARSKVHIFKTLFPAYLSKAHPYKEPTKPAPLCAFKFKISKLPSVTEYYQQFQTAIEYFGIFEFDDPRARRLASDPVDFTKRIVNQTGNEVIVIILRNINENVFLSFAGNYPMIVEENVQEVNQIVDDYFPEDAVDFDPNKYLEDITKYQEFYSEEDEGEEENLDFF